MTSRSLRSTYGRQQTAVGTNRRIDRKSVFTNFSLGSNQNESVSDKSDNNENLIQNDKENKGINGTKKGRPRRKNRVVSYKESGSDSSHHSLFSDTTRRDRKTRKNKEKLLVRSPKKPLKPKKVKEKSPEKEIVDGMNFSEFDDYSLMVVDSVEYNKSRDAKLGAPFSETSKKTSLQLQSSLEKLRHPVIETSTPNIHQKRHGSRTSPNMSGISNNLSDPEVDDLLVGECINHLSELDLQASPLLTSPLCMTDKPNALNGRRIRSNSLLHRTNLDSIAEFEPSRSLFSDAGDDVVMCITCHSSSVTDKYVQCVECRSKVSAINSLPVASKTSERQFEKSQGVSTSHYCDENFIRIATSRISAGSFDDSHSYKSHQSLKEISLVSIPIIGNTDSELRGEKTDNACVQDVLRAVIEPTDGKADNYECFTEDEDVQASNLSCQSATCDAVSMREMPNLSMVRDINEFDGDIKVLPNLIDDEDVNPPSRAESSDISSEGSVEGCIGKCTYNEERLSKPCYSSKKAAVFDDLVEYGEKLLHFENNEDNSSDYNTSTDIECNDEFNAMRKRMSRKSVGRLSISVTHLSLQGGSPLKAAPLTTRNQVLQLCCQDDFVAFEEILPPSKMKTCLKIGEGVYGEVFRTQSDGQNMALKIIPLEGELEVNGENQKTFEEIYPEILITKELDGLKENQHNSCNCFAKVNGVSCIQGIYPDDLLERWDLFNEQKESENDRPDNFPIDQLFIAFEFHDAGTDLANFKFNNINEAKSVIKQVILSLAVAEIELEFEHRDLHWGNILIQRTNDEQCHYYLEGQKLKFDNYGVNVTIIDFTLSRLSKDGNVLFCDLSTDETLFTGEGDYQFEVYRLMKKNNGDNWESYKPYTNVLWINYLLDKLINKTSYKQKPSSFHSKVMRTLRGLFRNILEYESAADLLKSDFFD